MIVRLLGSGRYTLAIAKNSGSAHEAGLCDYYANAHHGSNVERRFVQAIRVDDEGHAKVTLARPLTRRLAGAGRLPNPHPRRAGGGGTGIARGTTSLYATLKYMWEVTRLNTWHPATATRTEMSVSRRIYMAAKGITIGKIAVNTVLISEGHGFDRHARAGLLRTRFAVAGKTQALLLFGEIPSQPGALFDRLSALAARCGISIADSEGACAAAESSFARQVQYRRGRLIVLASGFKSARDTIDLQEIGILACSDPYIPIDSLYELNVADRLVAEARSFIKPVRDDGGAVVPDFILTDTAVEVEMEVFGRTDPDYLEKAERKKIRDIWWWDAATTDELPPFPPKSAK